MGVWRQKEVHNNRFTGFLEAKSERNRRETVKNGSPARRRLDTSTNGLSLPTFSAASH